MDILKDISCTLLPGKYANGSPVPRLYNELYRYWRRTWGEIFLKSGSPGSLNAENFLRQDIIITLHRGSEIAGTITTSFFNLRAEAVFDHPYLHPFPKDFVRKLRLEDGGMITTAEYLSVHPNFRKSIVGLPLADVLIGLNLRIFAESGALMTLATTVRPTKVHEIGDKYGYAGLGSFEKYGLDCVLLYNTMQQLREHEDPAVVALVEDCWERRRDLTGLTSASGIEGAGSDEKKEAA